jgi:hypothetical protein
MFSLTRSEQDSRSTFFHSIKKTEKAYRETKSDTRNLVKDTFQLEVTGRGKGKSAAGGYVTEKVILTTYGE